MSETQSAILPRRVIKYAWGLKMTLQVHVSLAELLRRHNITQQQLAQAARMRPATISALTRQQVERVEFGTLAAVVGGLRNLGIQADIGDFLQVVEQPDELQVARERALRLLGGSPHGLKPAGLAQPVEVSGPAIEELLTEHRGLEP